jgi:hypothetical protein
MPQFSPCRCTGVNTYRIPAVTVRIMPRNGLEHAVDYAGDAKAEGIAAPSP